MQLTQLIRVICQQYNVASLETVVKFFLQQAEERAKEAQVRNQLIFLSFSSSSQLIF
jgi:hypothetical protein